MHDVNRLHRGAMEHDLIGTDIYPIAAHLTSAMLAMETDQPYGNTNIGWIGVGNPARTGAIEYIVNNTVYEMTGMVSRSAGYTNGINYNSVVIHDGSIDVILMNPPYSRTRVGHSAFDIAGLTETERKVCQARWARLIQN